MMALFATVFSVTSAVVPTVEVTAAAIHGVNWTPSALAHMRSIVFAHAQHRVRLSLRSVRACAIRTSRRTFSPIDNELTRFSVSSVAFITKSLSTPTRNRSIQQSWKKSMRIRTMALS
jgi:hypothetical protein